MKKNEFYEAEITAITNEGVGIAKIDGMVVFVPNSVVGDLLNIKIVKVNKNYYYGIVDKIIKSAECRIEPECPVSTKCGGCCFSHISYDEELRIKDQHVKDCFERIGKITTEFVPIEPCESTKHYRNKGQYPVGYVNGKAYCGFFAKHTHRIVESESCLLQPEIFSQISADVIEYINKNTISVYNETENKGLVRHIYLRQGANTKEIMLCLVVSKNTDAFNDLAESISAKYTEIKSIILNINPKKTNVILGDKCRRIWGKDTITDIMCGNVIEISPLSFYQVNTKQAEKLYLRAKDFANVSKNDTVIDLYCGAGTIGLSFAKEVKKVIGVEIIPEAIENAKENAKRNNIENAEFICGDAGEVFAKLNEKPDLLIVDPPRKGCSEDLLKTIVDLGVEKIVMISCNPSTAARDSKFLNENGYKVEKVQPFDLFPRTSHVETVVQLVRKKPDTYIDITVDMDELDLTSSEAKATYNEIKDYIFDKHRVKVSSLYIAQIKQKHGIIERDCYNNSKKDNTKQPQCPPEKVKLIEEALRHFKMI